MIWLIIRHNKHESHRHRKKLTCNNLMSHSWIASNFSLAVWPNNRKTDIHGVTAKKLDRTIPFVLMQAGVQHTKFHRQLHVVAFEALIAKDRQIQAEVHVVNLGRRTAKRDASLSKRTTAIFLTFLDCLYSQFGPKPSAKTRSRSSASPRRTSWTESGLTGTCKWNIRRKRTWRGPCATAISFSTSPTGPWSRVCLENTYNYIQGDHQTTRYRVDQMPIDVICMYKKIKDGCYYAILESNKKDHSTTRRAFMNNVSFNTIEIIVFCCIWKTGQ